MALAVEHPKTPRDCNLSFSSSCSCGKKKRQQHDFFSYDFQSVFIGTVLCSLVLALAGHAVLNLRHYRMRRHLSSSAADKEAGPKVDVAVQEVNAQTAASNEKTSTPGASSENQFDWLDLFTSLGKLGLIMGYFFLCDR